MHSPSPHLKQDMLTQLGQWHICRNTALALIEKGVHEAMCACVPVFACACIVLAFACKMIFQTRSQPAFTCHSKRWSTASEREERRKEEKEREEGEEEAAGFGFAQVGASMNFGKNSAGFVLVSVIGVRRS